MQPEEIQLPIFVYGTLRPGARNYGVVRDFVAENGVRPASLQGFQMFDFKDFPGILEVHKDSRTEPVVGEILHMKPEMYHEALGRLDRLEAEGYLFNRTDKFYADIWSSSENGMRWSDRKKNSVRVWLYVGNPGVLYMDFRRVIKSNDWLNRGD